MVESQEHKIALPIGRSMEATGGWQTKGSTHHARHRIIDTANRTPKPRGNFVAPKVGARPSLHNPLPVNADPKLKHVPRSQTMYVARQIHGNDPVKKSIKRHYGLGKPN